MFNLSKIFEKNKKLKESPEKQTPQEIQSKPADFNISFLMEINPDEKSDEKANQIYEELFLLAKETHTTGKVLEEQIKKLNNIIENIIEILRFNELSFFKNFFKDYKDIEDYLFFHVANVTILSLVVGSYNQTQNLKEIGIGAFFHDIGLGKFLELIRKNQKLSKEEYNKIKSHPNIGIKILRSSPISESIVLKIVEQAYERLDGKGYPFGLKSEDIILPAQIVNIVDKYETLIHKRPYRDNKYSYFDAIKFIVNDKGLVSYNIKKNFIDRVGILPPGSKVRLNTKEEGTIIKNNLGFPLKPVIKIFLDANGLALKEPKEIDLSKNTSLYICFQ